MPIELQVKLLRVLESGVVARIGGERELQVDVRVIAATNKEPENAVSEGKLREDLLYRLSVFPIRLPPLRERTGDVELLVEYFLSQLNEAGGTSKRCTREALARLQAHHWPGNVRELKNLVHRAYILADADIDPSCLPPTGAAPSGAPEAGMDGSVLQLKVGCSVAEAERRLILATLDACGGNKEKAAKMLGISLKTLYNRLNEYRAG